MHFDYLACVSLLCLCTILVFLFLVQYTRPMKMRVCVCVRVDTCKQCQCHCFEYLNCELNIQIWQRIMELRCTSHMKLPVGSRFELTADVFCDLLLFWIVQINLFFNGQMVAMSLIEINLIVLSSLAANYDFNDNFE